MAQLAMPKPEDYVDESTLELEDIKMAETGNALEDIKLEVEHVTADIKYLVLPGAEKKKSARKKEAVETTTETVELKRKPELTAEDVLCPICWSILYEPTTLPCKHSLCLACYLKHAEETSLYCPCCRRRLSIWSRRARKRNELVDEVLWRRLKNEFTELIEAREAGDDSQDLKVDNPTVRDAPVIRDGTSAAPGMIYEELKVLIKPHEEDLRKKNLQNEIASISLIKEIEEVERKSVVVKEEQEKEDFLLATKLNAEINGLEEPIGIRKSSRDVKPRVLRDYCVPSTSRNKGPLLSNRRGTNSSKSSNMVAKKNKKKAIASTSKAMVLPKDTHEPVKSEETSLSAAQSSAPPSQEESGSSIIAECSNEQSRNQTESCSNNDVFDIEYALRLADEILMMPPDVVIEQLNQINPEYEFILPSDEEDEPDMQFYFDKVGLDSMEMPIDYERMEQEANKLEELKAKFIQEAEDRELALQLQRNFNLGILESRSKDSKNNYGLRSWKRPREPENDG